MARVPDEGDVEVAAVALDKPLFENLQLRGRRPGGGRLVPISAEQAEYDEERDEPPEKAADQKRPQPCSELHYGVYPTPAAVSLQLAAQLGT
jgi:hypothetical protein